MLDLIIHLMGQFEPIKQNKIGPSKGLHMIAWRLLWASSSASGRLRKFILWANVRS